MKSIFECGVLLRMYTLFMSALYSYAQLNHPETIMYEVAHSDMLAYYTAWALGILALLGFIDLFVNDIMPDRFVLLRALKDRHLVLMGIPVCFAIQMYSAVRRDSPLVILAYYGVYIFMVPASALKDILMRQKKVSCP